MTTLTSNPSPSLTATHWSDYNRKGPRTGLRPIPCQHGKLWKYVVKVTAGQNSCPVRVNWNTEVCWWSGLCVDRQSLSSWFRVSGRRVRVRVQEFRGPTQYCHSRVSACLVVVTHPSTHTPTCLSMNSLPVVTPSNSSTHSLVSTHTHTHTHTLTHSRTFQTYCSGIFYFVRNYTFNSQ